MILLFIFINNLIKFTLYAVFLEPEFPVVTRLDTKKRIAPFVESFHARHVDDEVHTLLPVVHAESYFSRIHGEPVDLGSFGVEDARGNN